MLFLEYDLEMDLLEMVELEIQLNTDLIEEGVIKSKDIGAPGKSKDNARNIMITGSGNASHYGRMKVSKRGVTISRSTSYNDYISIYRKKII